MTVALSLFINSASITQRGVLRKTRPSVPGWHAWDRIEQPIQPIAQETPTPAQYALIREGIQADDPNALSHRVHLPVLQDPSRILPAGCAGWREPPCGSCAGWAVAASNDPAAAGPVSHPWRPPLLLRVRLLVRAYCARWPGAGASGDGLRGRAVPKYSCLSANRWYNDSSCYNNY